ncbi:MAG: hypothetical protein LBU67_09865 [Oscillospiraceae bacterium]|jgi:hypothetical protein|nr:hypothetical protein [Oscillospiraceae bacterium]
MRLPYSLRQTTFDGFEAVEILTAQARAVLVHEVGPRIAFYGKPDGENLLYWDKDAVSRGAWKLRGGHRVWLTRPCADESVDTYIADNAPCRLSVDGPTVTATSPANGVNALARGMRVTVQPGGGLQVTNFVTNTGDLIYSGGVWSPTCVAPDGKTLRIPLGLPNSSWDIVRIVIPRVFAGNTSTLQDDQCRFEGNDLVVTPRGRVLKRACGALQGKVILDGGGLRFTKYAPYDKRLRYPFEGCNTAVFVGAENWMAELETFGGESEIPPGETIENTEYWSLAAV